MKYLLAIVLFAAPLTAQVTVTQGFLDDSNRAFVELKASREVIEAQKTTITAKNELIAAQAESIAVLKAQVADLSKLKCDTTSIFLLIKIKRCH